MKIAAVQTAEISARVSMGGEDMSPVLGLAESGVVSSAIVTPSDEVGVGLSSITVFSL